MYSTMHNCLRLSRKTSVLVLIIILSISSAAFALDLETARSQGLAGETDSGLLAKPPGADNAAVPLITTVNAQREAEYTRIAAQNSITSEVVGKMMFEKIFTKLPSGTWVRVNGSWSRK